MERKIGEIFEYNGEWYQCLEEKTCTCFECDFHDYNCDDINLKKVKGSCQSEYRKDNKSVIFKKLEKVGELIANRNMLFQKLRTDSPSCNNCIFNIQNHGCYKNYYIEGICYGDEIWVELKQKEDMKENKLNLKPFDLEAAKAGKLICTRDGRKARIVCFDRIDAKPILALVLSTDGKGEDVLSYFVSGKRMANSLESDLDLMMLPEEKEGYVNLYHNCNDKYAARLGNTVIYKDKEFAEDMAKGDPNYIKTVKVQWEE